MQSPLKILVVAGAAALMVACATDNTTSPIAASEAAAALVSAPIGFDQLNSSFVGDSDISFGFMPWRSGDGDLNRFGPGWHEFMGGGIGEGFIGGIGFGRTFALAPGFGRGPFGDWDDSDACAVSASIAHFRSSMQPELYNSASCGGPPTRSTLRTAFPGQQLITRRRRAQ